MYNRTKKIPTIIALLILLLGIGGGIFLIESRTSGSTKATGSVQPESIQITNLNDTSFSVIFLTKEPASGSLVYGQSQKDISQIAFDDRDIDNKAKPYVTHHITVRNLKPETVYFFTIISGNKKYQDSNKPYSITTAPKTDISSNLEPAYGQVLTQHNQPAEGAIVILNLPRSLSLSTVVKSSGNWLIPLNSAKGSDLKPYTSEGTIVESIIIYSSTEEQTQVTTDTNNDSPVPAITIGKIYNFEGLESKKKEESQLAQGEKQENVLGKQTGSKVKLIAPEEGATFVSNRPLFRGTGIPKKEVLIEVYSTKITGKTTVSTDGTWSWTPPKDLSPDKHRIKITTVDEKDKEISLERNFLVFKSGTQVLGEATPSGTLTPPASPSATLRPLFSPTPIATSSKIPVSGNISFTFYFLGAGIALLLVGFAKLIAKV